MKTTVINVRGRNRAELEADPNFVYVGRQVGRGRNFHWSRSDWGNPFKPSMTCRQAFQVLADHFNRCLLDRFVNHPDGTSSDVLGEAYCVELYRRWVLAFRPLRERLGELRGKTLGCWCCDWPGTGEPSKPCHAVVLARLADAMEDCQ